MVYNRDLANRFISDYKLPVPLTNKEEYFMYYMVLLEPEYKALTKYRELEKLVKERFNDNPQEFLKEYYDVRENIIQTMLSNEAYINFNEKMDLSVFAVKDKPNVSSNNIYNQENVNKAFISIDLKKANFQAMKYVNPEIVFNAETYEDFIGKFTDLDYVKKSKYSRQVVFGKCNPKRQITVEKYLINEVRKTFEEKFSCKSLKLVSMVTDELIYEVTDEKLFNSEYYETMFIENFNENRQNFKKVEDEIKKTLNIDVSIDLFKLEGYHLVFKESKSISKTFYNKYNGYKNKLVAVPLPFFPITYKLFNKNYGWHDTSIELHEYDYHFNYEGMDARLNEEFDIIKI